MGSTLSSLVTYPAGKLIKLCQLISSSSSKPSKAGRHISIKIKEEEGEEVVFGPPYEFPPEIMEMIISRLEISDRIRMTAVSKPWRSIAMQKHIQAIHPQPPWLVYPSNSNDHQLIFFDIFHGRVYNFDLPEPIRGGWCCGSSKGWLVMARDNLGGKKFDGNLQLQDINPQLFLFNPISGVHIELPSVTTIPAFEDYLEYPSHPYKFSSFIRKIDISSECASTPCIIAAIYDDCAGLAICQPNDKRWTTLKAEEDVNIIRRNAYIDILFFDGILYVLCRWELDPDVMNPNFKMALEDHKLEVWGIALDRGAEWDQDDDDDDDDAGATTEYLVECNKDLLLVCRNYSGVTSDSTPGLFYFKTSKFEVVGLNPTGNYSLEDQVVFLARKSSVSSISARHSNGMGRNCIYFLDDAEYGYMDYMGHVPYPDETIYHPNVVRESGVFNLDNGKIERMFPSLNFPHQPNWFTPHFG
ncbi:hypothetical protein Tsubulata_006324 [Turnera subulata]|uniref:F-box domain-containing protein n=1 Tax=Turnera subulata TaxID=218843 RepID=A0A9Q0G6H9_9ROSI|nr:hypothetical protein Tsubulata_006324 [Turnera subulata]